MDGRRLIASKWLPAVRACKHGFLSSCLPFILFDSQDPATDRS